MLFIIQGVMAKNYTPGPGWLPHMIVERNGPLLYLIKVSGGRLWRSVELRNWKCRASATLHYSGICFCILLIKGLKTECQKILSMHLSRCTKHWTAGPLHPWCSLSISLSLICLKFTHYSLQYFSKIYPFFFFILISLSIILILFFLLYCFRY